MHKIHHGPLLVRSLNLADTDDSLFTMQWYPFLVSKCCALLGFSVHVDYYMLQIMRSWCLPNQMVLCSVQGDF